MPKPKVAIVKGETPSLMVKQALQLIHAEELVSAEDRVLIKPNCVIPRSPSTGTTTDPRVVDALIQFAENQGVKDTVIAEGGAVGRTDEAFDVSGVRDVSTRRNVKLVNVNKDEGVRVKIPNARTLREVSVANTVMESTCIINVPVLKIHHMAVVTLCIKNLMGAILPPRNLTMHTDIDEKLVDLSSIIRPKINLISGIVGAEMDETSGSPVKMGLVVAGRDIVAVDAVGSAIMGVDPEEVEYLRLAEERGLGTGTLEKIDILGDPIASVERVFDRSLSETRRKSYAKTYGPDCLSCPREELRRYWEGRA